MPVAFDTHALITRLIQGQMPQAQAEAMSEALKEALDEAVGQLATKKDVADLGADLRKDLTQLGNRLSWMIGVNLTLTLLMLGKLLLFKP